MTNEWSPEFGLNAEGIKNAPSSPGVYEILQEVEYPRYASTTRIVKIGMSESDLKAELRNHLDRHTTANRIKRMSRSRIITFRFRQSTANQARDQEKQLLKEFEDVHWDVPVCNSTRGYARGEDRHYCK